MIFMIFDVFLNDFCDFFMICYDFLCYYVLRYWDATPGFGQ